MLIDLLEVINLITVYKEGQSNDLLKLQWYEQWNIQGEYKVPNSFLIIYNHMLKTILVKTWMLRHHVRIFSISIEMVLQLSKWHLSICKIQENFGPSWIRNSLYFKLVCTDAVSIFIILLFSDNHWWKFGVSS